MMKYYRMINRFYRDFIEMGIMTFVVCTALKYLVMFIEMF